MLTFPIFSFRDNFDLKMQIFTFLGFWGFGVLGFCMGLI